MPTVLTGGVRPGAFLLTEGQRTISRDSVIFLAGTLYKPGTVLGKVTSSGKFCPFNPAAATGAEVAQAIAFYGYDATAGDVQGVIIARHAEVISGYLIWPTGIAPNDLATGIASLKSKGIQVR